MAARRCVHVAQVRISGSSLGTRASYAAGGPQAMLTPACGLRELGARAGVGQCAGERRHQRLARVVSQ